MDDIEKIELVIRTARSTIDQCYAVERHQIAATILTVEGNLVSGVHIEAMVGRASICAEAVALGNAVLGGVQNSLSLIAAVRNPKPSEVDRVAALVAPCGLCREILLDYAPNLRVIVGSLTNPTLINLGDLLPHKYIGTKWVGLPIWPQERQLAKEGE